MVLFKRTHISLLNFSMDNVVAGNILVTKHYKLFNLTLFLNLTQQRNDHNSWQPCLSIYCTKGLYKCPFTWTGNINSDVCLTIITGKVHMINLHNKVSQQTDINNKLVPMSLLVSLCGADNPPHVIENVWDAVFQVQQHTCNIYMKNVKQISLNNSHSVCCTTCLQSYNSSSRDKETFICMFE